MDLWVAAILSAACITGGIWALLRRGKTRRTAWLAAGIILLLMGAACVLYTAAALLLLGGID